jgi:molecular chaperone DnaK
MVEDALLHANDDKQRKEVIDARNQLDNLIYATDKAFNENKEKLSSADVGKITDALEVARKALTLENADDLKKAMKDFESVSHKIAEALSKQPESHAESNTSKDDVIDAEYE